MQSPNFILESVRKERNEMALLCNTNPAMTFSMLKIPNSEIRYCRTSLKTWPGGTYWCEWGISCLEKKNSFD
jgi:hypothetical protein